MLLRPIHSASTIRTRLLSLGIGLVGTVSSLWGQRGLWQFCQYAIRPIAGADADLVVELGPDCLMSLSLADPYWSRLISSAYRYESEIEYVLSAISTLDFGFIDAGANFGYWSVLVTSERFGSHCSVAIEASNKTFDRLSKNCGLNRNRFSCLHRAVASRSGEILSFHTGKDHASASLIAGAVSDAAVSENTTTCTIDGVAAEYFPTQNRFVVKLDVEGAEIDALEGARLLLRKDTLLIYEDHGRDDECGTTRFVIENLRKSVYFVEGRGSARKLRRIHSPADARAVKQRATVGYNFFAVDSDSQFLAHILRALPVGPT